MKKYVLGLVALIGSSFLANAQRFSLGPNAGFGVSKISGFNNSDFRSAGNVGISMIYSAIGHFGIGADLKYSIEGGEIEVANGPDTDIRLDYIRVPIKAMWFFGDYGQKLRPKIALGPSFGFLVGGRDETVASTEISDTWDTFDVGLLGSAGLNYRLVRNTWFNADVAYTHGLKNNRKGTTNNFSYKNRNLGLNIGVNFGL